MIHPSLMLRWSDYYVQATRLRLYIEQGYSPISISIQRGVCRRLSELFFNELEGHMPAHSPVWPDVRRSIAKP